MKIWKIDCEVDDYAIFLLKDKHNEVILEEKLDKGKDIDLWESLFLEIRDDCKPIGDNPKLWVKDKYLLVSEKVKDLIEHKFKSYVQLLPMEYKDGGENYYLLNIKNIIDCIDYDKSEFRKLMDLYIVDVTKYVFKDSIKKVPIFKIYLDGIIKSDIYVNDDFKRLVEYNSLKGFKFTEVYDFES